MRVWTDERKSKAIQHKAEGMTYRDIAQMFTNLYGHKFTPKAIKNTVLRTKEMQEIEESKPGYKQETEILSDGSHRSDKPLRMSEAQKKDPTYLLEAHGYDSDKWEVVSAKNSTWNQHNKQDGTLTLYSSKLTVKPKSVEFDFNKLVEAVEKRPQREPIMFEGPLPKEETYLEIPLFDLHFGIADLDYYQDTLQGILELLQKKYSGILIFVGQDLLHNDNFKGETSNGTPIDKVDMPRAIDDAEQFYITIIDQAIKSSPNVTVSYNKGNHDQSMSYMLVRGLRNYYRGSNITFDTEFKERKAFMLGSNFIGTTHGDKNRANLASNFTVEFPYMWSQATTREVHIGHLHRKKATKKGHEFINDADGLIVRELGTGNKVDQYHEDNGFNLAHKEFEVFEYTEIKKKRIHYV